MRVASAVLLIVFLAGCGADPLDNSPGVLPAPPRLGVDDALRGACPLTSDADIRDMLEECEVKRLLGLTEQEQLDALLRSCTGTGRLSPCHTCAVAVLRQIYDL